MILDPVDGPDVAPDFVGGLRELLVDPARIVAILSPVVEGEGGEDAGEDDDELHQHGKPVVLGEVLCLVRGVED